MFTENQWKSRFNLLYLHENEVKTEERSANCSFVDPTSKQQYVQAGLLHIGSKSIFFEPQNEAFPILKFLMRNFTSDVKSESSL